MKIRKFYIGSQEFVSARVKSNVDLTTQDVQMSFDRLSSDPEDATWVAAEWVGDASKSRVCQVLVEDNMLPIGRDQVPVFVRVIDAYESPVVKAGTLLLS